LAISFSEAHSVEDDGSMLRSILGKVYEINYIFNMAVIGVTSLQFLAENCKMTIFCLRVGPLRDLICGLYTCGGKKLGLKIGITPYKPTFGKVGRPKRGARS
jgi:hypothetical protein